LKLLLAIAAVVLVAAVTTMTASASALRLSHRPFNTMTRQGKITYLHRQAFHDHSIIRFWRNHRDLSSTHKWIRGIQVHWALVSLRIVQRNLQRLSTPVYTVHRSITASSSVIANLLCIHKYEGAWNANTGNGYYGGLQMDLTFQQSYGGWYLTHVGTANLWPVSVQLQVAAKAVASRGYSPWPKTARMCGLY
jgi:Transglycosylase-like domain